MISEKAKEKRKKIISQLEHLDIYMKMNEIDEMAVLRPAIEKLGLWLSFPVGDYIDRINEPYQEKYDELLVQMLDTK